MHILDYERLILALTDINLEKLVREWAECQKTLYNSTQRKAGAGDLGRDVVGFYTPQKHEGDWDNYQCKQYSKTLPTANGMLEIGKILYHASKNEFVTPKNYYFVAPRGVNKNLDSYISNPSIFKKSLIDGWDSYCRYKIVQNGDIPLTKHIRTVIDTYDFSTIDVIDIDTMVNDEKFRGILVHWFGGDLLPPPIGEVPIEIQERETKYLDKVLDSYSDHDNTPYNKIDDIIEHEWFHTDFEMQRERYYSAETFKCFYRDNTVTEVLKSFEKEIISGVISTSLMKYSNAFECMCKVMEQAAIITPSGKLSPHAKIDVKQGYCHHFANIDKLNWRRK